MKRKWMSRRKKNDRRRETVCKGDMMNSLEMNNIEEIKTLNPYQQEAVLDESPACLVNANVGSGKTTVLIEKVRHLHEKKQVSYEKMAVLTFTNKAAGELKERLRNMLGGEEGDEVFASTFHSACVRILRRWAEEIGYPRSFTIYDTDDAQRVMKTVYKELSVDDKFFPIKSAINQMSRWKDQLVSPEQALASPAKDTKGALTARIYAAYEKRLKEAGAFDFDDLIYQTVQLLAEHKDVRDFYQNKYR